MSHRLFIKLSNLYLDLKNPRYEEQRSQNEALNTIAKEQKEKLLVLLRDILNNGLNPTDIPIVMSDPTKDSGYVVLEGNRRIAALKLYKKPSILSNENIRQKFAKLQEEYKGKPFNSNNIECMVVNSREEANLWIERKHEGEMNGAGTVKWDSVQKNRFMAIKTGKDTKVIQLIDFMKSATNGDTEFSDQLGKVKPTNLERLLSTPEVCSDLGLTYVKGEYITHYEWTEVLKGLKYIVSILSQSDFKVSCIYSKKDRIDFIKKVPVDKLPDKTKKADKAWKLKDFKPASTQTSKDNREDEDSPAAGMDQKTPKTGGQQERPTNRNTFLPESLILEIPNDRINRIYSELKLLSHISQPNTCGIMMRVFLELSVDKYMEAFDLLKKDALTGARDKRDLKQKTNEVINHMNQTKRADEAICKGMKTVANKDKSTFSIDTMNAFVHNGDFNPIPEDLMLTWDNVQPFVIALWKAICEKGNE